METVIVQTARSPIGRARKGSLATCRPDDLLAQVVRALLDSVPGLEPGQLEDFHVGCGMPGGEQGYNIARVVAVQLGLDHLPGTTVNRYCASSLQALRMAHHAIQAGEGEMFLAGGVETVSRFAKGSSDDLPGTRNPLFFEAETRTARQAESGTDWSDPRLDDTLPDIYIPMGQTAENVAQAFGVSRYDQDEFAALSQARAQEAIAAGFFEREITPVTTPEGVRVDTDDCPRPGTTTERLAELDPIFRAGGTVTAGNSCPLNDGAAAVLVMSDSKARAMGFQPRAKVLSTAVSALSPEIMGMGPVESTRRALARAGMKIQDLHQLELNEAFAAQAVACERELGIDRDRLNPRGGAIALGHPFGMTGARMVATLLNSLEQADMSTGAITMCVAGGQGMSLVLERI